MTLKLSWIFFILPSIILTSVRPAFAQLLPTQVITLTVGNRGSVETTRTRKEKDNDQFFSFSLSTEDKKLQNKNNKKKGKAQTQTEYDFNVRSGTYVLESGRKREVTRIKTVDTYDYIDSTFNQSISIDY